MKKRVVVALSLVFGMLLATNKTVVEEVEHIDLQTYNTLLQKKWYDKCLSSVKCKWLAQATYYEARGESDEGVAAVAYVILNRVKHPTLWPSTVAEVIKQKAQFSYRWDGSMNKGFTEKDQYVRVATISARVLDGDIDNPVGDSNHYHNRYVSPKWAKKKQFVVQIGTHLFYK